MLFVAFLQIVVSINKSHRKNNEFVTRMVYFKLGLDENDELKSVRK